MEFAIPKTKKEFCNDQLYLIKICGKQIIEFAEKLESYSDKDWPNNNQFHDGIDEIKIRLVALENRLKNFEIYLNRN